MLLRGRSHPRAVHWARGVSCGGCDELVRCRTKRTVCTKGNSLEANVEALLLDDLVRAAILGGSVRISAGGTHLTQPLGRGGHQDPRGPESGKGNIHKPLASRAGQFSIRILY